MLQKYKTSDLMAVEDKGSLIQGKKVTSAENNLVNSKVIIKNMVVKRQNKTTAEDGYRPRQLPTVFASVILLHSGVRKQSLQAEHMLAGAHFDHTQGKLL